MAQTPHQQIQVVQQQPVSSAQLQQLYFPQQQMVFPGNITLQQATAGQHTLQAIAPNRTYSSAPVGLLPKAIQPTAIPVHSIAGAPRHIGHQMTTQAAGTSFQPANFLGSFATLGNLPVGYQWATNMYQQNPIIIRSPHPNIYVQPPPAMQIPISAGQQIVTPTSYTTNPHIQLETQTIATQTLVPSVSAVNSTNAYIQIQDPNIPPAPKPSPSASPSSSTTEASNVQIQSQQQQPQQQQLSTQSATHHVPEESPGVPSSETEAQSTEVQSEFAAEEEQREAPTSSPRKPALAPGALLANTDSSCATAVSSTTPTAPAPISHVHSYVSSLGKRTIAMVGVASPPAVPQSSEDAAAAPSSEVCGPSEDKDEVVEEVKVVDGVEPVAKLDPFSPKKTIKHHPYLRPMNEKQPQKAIVKPQMLSHVKEASVEKEEQETYLEGLKTLADSPPKELPEEPDSLVVEDIIEGQSSFGKMKVIRGRGRPRGTRHHKFKQAERRRSLRQQSQIEILEVIERNVPQASEVSTSRSSEETSSSVLPESHKSEPSTSISASSIASDIVEVMDHKLDVKMPKTPPNTWTVEEVFEFIQGFPGCLDHAESFKSQEIDGQALLLIKLDHLMTGMAMKLGPAVKLIAHIRSMKDQLSS